MTSNKQARWSLCVSPETQACACFLAPWDASRRLVGRGYGADHDKGTGDISVAVFAMTAAAAAAQHVVLHSSSLSTEGCTPAAPPPTCLRDRP